MKDIKKDPNALLDYSWDWSQWLANGETIVDATVFPSSGITLESSTYDTTSVTAWLSGGTLEVAYNITCHIVTSAGREEDRTIRIYIEEK